MYGKYVNAMSAAEGECKSNVKGRIRKVFHFADIHIRCGEDEASSRFDQYLEAFSEVKRFFTNVDTTDCIAVVVGDVFHMKGKADVFAITMLGRFIDAFPERMPVYIIRGNHDVVQQRPNQPDLLEALLRMHPNVHYIKKTTAFKVGNLGFSVVDIMDVLEHGTSSGKQIDELPEIPRISMDEPAGDNAGEGNGGGGGAMDGGELDIDRRVILFHGTIIRSRLQNYSESVQGFPLDWFSDFDLGMFGDVHLQQIHADEGNIFFKDKLTWGYPGSLIQQNYGEEIINHGFLEWDLETNKVATRNVKAQHGYLKLKLRSPFRVLNSKAKNLEEILRSSVCPDDLSLRIYGGVDTTKMNEVKCMIEKERKSCTMTRMTDEFATKNGEIGAGSDEPFVENSSIVNFNTKSSWIDHIAKDEREYWYSGWKQLIEDPSLLSIELPANTFSPFVEDKVSKKNQDMRCLGDVDTEMLSFKPSIFKLNYMEWAWILCFGGGNYLNFDDIHTYTALISGQNAVGKTSFLECILIGLFGETSPGKSNSVFSGSIIHHLKPKNEKCFIQIEFQLDGDVYTLKRCFRVEKDSTKLKESDVTLCSASFTHPLSGTRTVNEWIKKRICPISEFLQSVMLCQSDAKDFFHMNSAEQLSKIECSQNMNAVNKFSHVLDDAYKTYSSITNFIEEILANEVSEMRAFEEGDFDRLESEKSDLEASIRRSEDECVAMRDGLKDFETRHLMLDRSEIDKRIEELSKKIDEFPEVTKTKEELLVEKGKILQIDDKLQRLHISHVDDIDLDVSREFVQMYDRLKTSNNDLSETIDSLTQELHDIHEQENVFHLRLRELPTEKDFDFASALKTKKKLAKLLPEKRVIEKNLSKLEQALSTYDALHVDYSAHKSKVADLRGSLNDLMSKCYPFNPDCEACKAQPWNLQRNDLQKTIDITAEKVSNIEASIESMETTIEDKRQRYQKNYEQHEFLEANDLRTLDEAIENFQVQQDLFGELEACVLTKTEIQSNIQESKLRFDDVNRKLQELSKPYDDHRMIIDSSVDISKLIDFKRVNEMLVEIDERDAYLGELGYWKGVLAGKSVHDEMTELDDNVRSIKAKLQETVHLIEHLEEAKRKHDDLLRRQMVLDELKSRTKTIYEISESFKSFREHIFNDLLLPFVCSKVNSLVANVSSNDSLHLSGSLHTRKTKMRSYDEIDWKVNYDRSSLPIEKASGFQRAILSFAMVITLNSINTKIKNDQLFVDEGFVHFDGQHLSRVFDLLHGFQNEYRQIILVSHLDELKQNANMCIDIIRSSQKGNSSLTFGSRKVTEGTVKKRGRPKKVY